MNYKNKRNCVKKIGKIIIFVKIQKIGKMKKKLVNEYKKIGCASLCGRVSNKRMGGARTFSGGAARDVRCTGTRQSVNTTLRIGPA